MAAAWTRRDSTTSRSSDFEHEPLDYTRGAIRLLRILPNLSPSGLIQCEIWHDNVNTEYTCLSYVWGPETIQQQILINGKLCWVRENLWNFMRVFRTKEAHSLRTLWVDALCIDQGSIWEKNHQVAQMGSIYSKAVEVIAWLGLSQSMGRAFTCALELKPSSWGSEMMKEWRIRNEQSNGQQKEDWFTVIRNGYWTRAWITQEILLANQIKIWVNNLEIEPRRISHFAEAMTLSIHHLGERRLTQRIDDRDHKSRIFAFYMRHMGQGLGDIRKSNEEQKLITLFANLPGRQSYYIHDRVYSLISIAADAPNIKVDYRASPGELLNQLLEIYSTTMCICSWFYISDMLDVHHIPDSRHGREDRVPVFKIPMRADQTEFVMPQNPKDWHHSCVSCSKRMDSFDSNGEISFCISSLCTQLQGAHLYVKKLRTGKYSIRRSDSPVSHEVMHFQPAKLDAEDGLALSWGAQPEMWDIFLTGDVLMRLFRMPEQKVREKFPLRICNLASSGAKRVEFCENIWACGR
ncbi:hypothetical protein P3342_008850 [Pyrenophora teres f. teres]|nr:hypothetical protein P3342_008850 [Pyrenophora teres f. teres]